MTQELIERLEPCPFCGWPATAMMDDHTKVWRVYCNDDGTCGDDAPGCCAEGPEAMTEAEAITAWNTRDQSQSARIAELEGVLTDARNNILSLLGGFRDDMPDAAVKLFQAQARQIDASLTKDSTSG